MTKHRLIMALIILAGLINFAPVIGVLSGARIESLYGIELHDPTVEILLRHRAVLFGILGGFMVAAAFQPRLHKIAMTIGLVAMVSFMGLFFLGDDQPASLMSIIYADIVGVIALIVAAILSFQDQRKKGLH